MKRLIPLGLALLLALTGTCFAKLRTEELSPDTVDDLREVLGEDMTEEEFQLWLAELETTPARKCSHGATYQEVHGGAVDCGLYCIQIITRCEKCDWILDSRADFYPDEKHYGDRRSETELHDGHAALEEYCDHCWELFSQPVTGEEDAE